VINGKRGITPSTALRLAKFFETSEDFWLNLQVRWDLYRTKQKESREIQSVQPIERTEHALSIHKSNRQSLRKTGGRGSLSRSIHHCRRLHGSFQTLNPIQPTRSLFDGDRFPPTPSPAVLSIHEAHALLSSRFRRYSEASRPARAAEHSRAMPPAGIRLAVS